MPYVAPTYDEFVNRFSIFADRDQPQVVAILAEAGRGVDSTWAEEDYKPAIMYLAAHLLTLDASQEGDDPAIGPSGAGEVIASESISGMSVSYFNPNAGSAPSEYAMTEYGRRYLKLLNLNRGGPLVI